MRTAKTRQSPRWNRSPEKMKPVYFWYYRSHKLIFRLFERGAIKIWGNFFLLNLYFNIRIRYVVISLRKKRDASFISVPDELPDEFEFLLVFAGEIRDAIQFEQKSTLKLGVIPGILLKFYRNDQQSRLCEVALRIKAKRVYFYNT